MDIQLRANDYEPEWHPPDIGVDDADLLTLPAIEAIGEKRSTLACEVTIPGSFTLTFDVTVEDHEWEVTATL